MSDLYKKSYVEWAAESGLGRRYTINDHAQAVLETLTSNTGRMGDLMFEFLGDLGYTGSLNDRLNAWDGVFTPGTDSFLLLEDGTSFILLEDGTSKLILD